MKNQKEKKQLYIIRSLRMTNWLCQHKFKLLKVEDSTEDSHYKVFLFENTPDFRQAMNEYYKEVKTKKEA